MNSEYVFALATIPMGVFITLKYVFTSIIFGVVIGSFIAAGQICQFKVISLLCKFYVSILRGTPVLLQLSIFYFGIPSITGFDISVTMSGILCFSLNSSAYISEIIRGGILSIDKGQFEAADSLNISGFTKYLYIIAPQVARNITPSMINELIALIKESSIISIIGEADIMRNATLVSAQYYNFFTPLMVAGATYYIIVLFVTFVAKYCENKLAFYG